MVRWMLHSEDGEEVLVVLDAEGMPLSATHASHSNFDELVAAARANDEDVYDLFDTGRVVERKFNEVANAVNGRISVRGGSVFYDDDPLDNVVAEKILDFLREGEDFTPLARFVENVMANPQADSREQFYRWIEGHHFPIADDGTIVAYKSVNAGPDGNYQSVNAGHAFVNGVEFGETDSDGNVVKSAYIPQNVGDVVTMPRSEVAHDPHVACHTGLHAGTWEYTEWFHGSTKMLVKINPRDVVSVPHDHTSQKVRVCRYEVIGFADTKSEALRYVEAVAEGDAEIAKAESEADPDDVLVDVPVEPKSVPAVKRLTKAEVAKAFGTKVDGVFNDGDPVVIKMGRNGNRHLALGDFGARMSDYVGKRGVVRESLNLRYAQSAHWVYIGGEKIDFWDDELQHDPQGNARSTGTDSASKVDTRTNHLRQKRGPGGRFLPKGS